MKQEIGKAFFWTTQDGEVLAPSEMRTTHLFYALRMLFNHTVDSKLAIEGGRYSGVREWPKGQKRQAVFALVNELKKRKPLPAWMIDQLRRMQQNSRERLTL